MRRNRKKTSLILTDFALYRRPRFKGGPYHNFIGWSKPRIEIDEVKTIRKNEKTLFANRQVELIDIKHDCARLSFTGRKPSSESEIREYITNKPISTGHSPGLHDGSCEYFIGCWTSRVLWGSYYLRTILARQHEINISRIQSILSYFTKRALMIYYNRCRYMGEDLYERLKDRISS